MFNLLVSSDGWAEGGRDTMPLGRVLEYTDDHVSERFSVGGRPDLESMISLPSLFMPENGGDAAQLAKVGTIARATVAGNEVVRQQNPGQHMIMDRFAKKVFLITVPFLFIAPVSARDDSRPRYLAPEAFAGAPAKVVAELKARGCMIPQARTGKAHNLIQGEFIAKGQVDWAVLCSREGKSSILLISDNNAKCQEHGTGDDTVYMQRVDRQKVQYSRLIRKQTRNEIAKRLSESGPSSRLAPERVDHDGIGDVYVGKASTTLYCMEGRWVELDGAD